MSAYIVDDKTINSAVAYICSEAMQYNREPLNKLGYLLPLEEGAKKLAKDMFALNVRSVQAFYPNEDFSGSKFRYKASRKPESNPIQALMTLRCFLYQACEGDCDQDPLYLALDYVAGNLAQDIVKKLPEWDACKWE